MYNLTHLHTKWQPCVGLDSWHSVTLSCRIRAQWSIDSTVKFWLPGKGQSLSSPAGPRSMITGAMGSRSKRWAVSWAWARLLFYFSKLALNPSESEFMNCISLFKMYPEDWVCWAQRAWFWWASQGESDSALGYLQQVDIPLSWSKLLIVRLLLKDCNDTERYTRIIGYQSQ